MLKNGKTANRNIYQNRKTEVFRCKSRKTDLNNGQNRETENPNLSTNVSFLDVNVSLTNDGNISTDLYTKPTDKHQYLLYSSCHPLHTKKAIPFSLLHSAYDAFVLLTKLSIYALVNLLHPTHNRFTNQRR